MVLQSAGGNCLQLPTDLPRRGQHTRALTSSAFPSAPDADSTPLTWTRVAPADLNARGSIHMPAAQDGMLDGDLLSEFLLLDAAAQAEVLRRRRQAGGGGSAAAPPPSAAAVVQLIETLNRLCF